MGLQKPFDKISVVSRIWELTLLFYLLRSIAEPLKYLFFFSFGLLVISYSYYLILNFKDTKFLKFLWVTKEFHILGIFLISGILLSAHTQMLSVKSMANYFVIAFICLVYYELRDHLQAQNLFRGWMLITLAIGLFGIIKWINFLIGLEINIFSKLYVAGTSLVSDYNFYASYFIASLLIYLYGLYNGAIRRRVFINLAILLSIIFIIAMTGSRRGIVVLGILSILSMFIIIFRWEKRKNPFYKSLFYLNIALFSVLLIVVSLIPIRSKIIQRESTRKYIASSVFRYSTLFNPNGNYFTFYDKLWPLTSTYKNDTIEWENYASYNYLVDGAIRNEYRDLKKDYWRDFESKNNAKNLFYNGDFKFGRKFWRIYAKAHITQEIIPTDYGNAIRVSRSDGSGNWPLEYDGRQIVYYKGVTYTFRFKYRVVEGKGVPFKIGWWLDEGFGPVNDLDYRITDLGDGWFEYTSSYTFKNDQRDLLTFMNSQRKNTVIDFTHIELTSDDTLNRPAYLDQFFQLEGRNLLYNGNFEHGLRFWGSVTRDTIVQSIVDTEFGKAIRISRKKGKGMWSLVYHGREIFYYKDITYHLRFKFRVIEGSKIPFKIGWRAMDENPIPYDLHKNIFPISDEWYECIVSHQFSKDYYGEIITFLNNQEPNTTIELTDIEMLCADTMNRPMYSDEMLEMITQTEKLRLDSQMQTVNNRPFSNRIARWKYALEVWNKYPWYNKIFGDGFEYLEKFGRKFYPQEQKVDYPHNPIISSFLYSGIIGGLFYIYFLSLSLYYYLKYRRHHMLFLILYSIFLIFTLISGDNHFSVPIFALLSLVPFISKDQDGEKEQLIHN